jgi:hypothetical protein
MWLMTKAWDNATEKCKIIENPLSMKDHRGITLKIYFEQVIRGPGFWKKNENVTKSDIFSKAFKQFWETWKKELPNFSNIKDWWDIGKMKIKVITIWAAIKLKQLKYTILKLWKQN